MLPVVSGERETRKQLMIYSLGLVAVSLLGPLGGTPQLVLSDHVRHLRRRVHLDCLAGLAQPGPADATVLRLDRVPVHRVHGRRTRRAGLANQPLYSRFQLRLFHDDLESRRDQAVLVDEEELRLRLDGPASLASSISLCCGCGRGLPNGSTCRTEMDSCSSNSLALLQRSCTRTPCRRIVPPTPRRSETALPWRSTQTRSARTNQELPALVRPFARARHRKSSACRPVALGRPA